MDTSYCVHCSVYSEQYCRLPLLHCITCVCDHSSLYMSRIHVYCTFNAAGNTSNWCNYSISLCQVMSLDLPSSSSTILFSDRDMFRYMTTDQLFVLVECLEESHKFACCFNCNHEQLCYAVGEQQVVYILCVHSSCTWFVMLVFLRKLAIRIVMYLVLFCACLFILIGSTVTCRISRFQNKTQSSSSRDQQHVDCTATAVSYDGRPV